MTSAPDDLRLAADFAPATYEDWRKLVDGVLKGASFEKLVGRTYDNLRIEPIYPRARAAGPIGGRAAAVPWRIMQRIDHPDAALANAQALHDLENGANGLTLVFAGANGAHGFGLEPTAEALEKVLGGGWPRFTWPNMSNAGASIPRPAISASALIRSAPAPCGDQVPTTGPKSCRR
jgi:methylmalonyl-CoA mutase